MQPSRNLRTARQIIADKRMAGYRRYLQRQERQLNRDTLMALLIVGLPLAIAALVVFL